MSETIPHARNDKTYDRILVPLDGSDEAEAALAVAEKMPSRELILLHVQTDEDIFIPEWITDPKADPAEISVRAELERHAARLRTVDRRVTIVADTGDVAEQIITAAMDADLIIMTTHGRGAAGRLIFGSVADRVVRHGMTPTLLLRAGEQTAAPTQPTRVVVPLDGSAKAEQSLPAAVKLARILDLPVLLLRAVGFDEIRVTLRKQRETGEKVTVDTPDRYEQARAKTREDATGYLAAQEETLRAAGLTVTSEVLDGSAAFTLLWAITASDITVMTTHGRSGYKRWSIGSVAEKLVRQAPGPVLLQRAAPEAENAE